MSEDGWDVIALGIAVAIVLLGLGGCCYLCQ